MSSNSNTNTKNERSSNILAPSTTNETPTSNNTDASSSTTTTINNNSSTNGIANNWATSEAASDAGTAAAANNTAASASTMNSSNARNAATGDNNDAQGRTDFQQGMALFARSLNIQQQLAGNIEKVANNCDKSLDQMQTLHATCKEIFEESKEARKEVKSNTEWIKKLLPFLEGAPPVVPSAASTGGPTSNHDQANHPPACASAARVAAAASSGFGAAGDDADIQPAVKPSATVTPLGFTVGAHGFRNTDCLRVNSRQLRFGSGSGLNIGEEGEVTEDPSCEDGMTKNVAVSPNGGARSSQEEPAMQKADDDKDIDLKPFVRGEGANSGDSSSSGKSEHGSPTPDDPPLGIKQNFSDFEEDDSGNTCSTGSSSTSPSSRASDSIDACSTVSRVMERKMNGKGEKKKIFVKKEEHEVIDLVSDDDVEMTEEQSSGDSTVGQKDTVYNKDTAATIPSIAIPIINSNHDSDDNSCDAANWTCEHCMLVNCSTDNNICAVCGVDRRNGDVEIAEEKKSTGDSTDQSGAGTKSDVNEAAAAMAGSQAEEAAMAEVNEEEKKAEDENSKSKASAYTRKKRVAATADTTSVANKKPTAANAGVLSGRIQANAPSGPQAESASPVPLNTNTADTTHLATNPFTPPTLRRGRGGRHGCGRGGRRPSSGLSSQLGSSINRRSHRLSGKTPVQYKD